MPDKKPVANEVWLKVIEWLDPKALKNARLVNKAWRDFATPHLFRTAIFSPEPLNVKNLRKLARTEHLAKFVEVLHLDCTTTMPKMVEPYAVAASNYFAKVFALGEQKTGPLCAANLLEVLQTDSSAHLNHKYLTGKPRGHFIAGFTLYNARFSYADRMSRADEVYAQLVYVTSKFINLKHVGTLSYWTTSKEPYQDDFKQYLINNLPRKSIDLISGINPPPGLVATTKTITSGSNRQRTFTSAFGAPGAAARGLHVMILPPSYSACSHDTHTHEIINGALRALRKNNFRLVSLFLPGPDELDHTKATEKRDGIVPLPSLLEGVQSKTSSLVLPLFRTLKVLELNIDFVHGGNTYRSRRGFYAPLDSIRNAIQQMSQLESLSIGAPKALLGDHSVWDLSKLLLFKEADYPEVDEEDDAGDDDADFGIPPPEMSQFLNMMLGGILAGTAPGNNNPAPTNGSSSQPAASSAASMLGSMPPVQLGPAVVAGVETVTANGATTAHALPPIAIPPIDMSQLLGTSQGPGLSNRRTSATPLKPNPWPKLKYLSLWNLPASPQQLSRLVKTVKGSLKVLKLDNIHFGPVPTPLDLSRGHHHPHHNHTESEAPEPSVDGSENESDGGDEDLPELLDTEDASLSASHVANTSEAAPVHEVPSSSGVPQTGPASAQPNGQSQLQSNVQTQTQPQGPPQPQTDGNQSTTTSTKPEAGKAWLETIEMLADELSLDECSIVLHPTEEYEVCDALAKQLTVNVWEEMGPFSIEISRYLLGGNGIGFPLHTANRIQQISEGGDEE
ncbi:uncharacterized protein AB675_4908, partial [Cyphellophora attinorum]